MNDPRIESFLATVRARLYEGARVYGDLSFDKPPITTIKELLQEVEDIAGWAFVLHTQLSQRLSAIHRASSMLTLREIAARGAELDQPGEQDGC